MDARISMAMVRAKQNSNLARHLKPFAALFSKGLHRHVLLEFNIEYTCGQHSAVELHMNSKMTRASLSSSCLQQLWGISLDGWLLRVPPGLSD